MKVGAWTISHTLLGLKFFLGLLQLPELRWVLAAEHAMRALEGGMADGLRPGMYGTVWACQLCVEQAHQLGWLELTAVVMHLSC